MPLTLCSPLAALAAVNPTPPVERYLFESPWIPAGVLVALAVVAFWTLNTRGKAKLASLVALAAIALAGLVVTTAALVTTDRERIMNATRELVRAVGANDAQAIASRLDVSVRLDVPISGVPDEASREQIVAQVERLHRSIRVDGASVTGVRADTRGSEIGRSLAAIRVNTADAPPGSRWVFDWALVPQPDGEPRWVVTRMEAVMIPGLVGDL